MLAVLLIFVSFAPADSEVLTDHFQWDSIPMPLDEQGGRLGLSGHFSGVHNDALIIAGGTNFEISGNSQTRKKIWHDKIYVLLKSNESRHLISSNSFLNGSGFIWEKSSLTLDIPTAYGASVSCKDGVICIGGKDRNGNLLPDVFMLKWQPEQKEVIKESLPDLPIGAVANAGLIDNVLYVAACIRDQGKFWCLDLNRRDSKGFGWIELDSYDGPARTAAVSGVQNGCFYIFSGRMPKVENAQTSKDYQWLCDGYRYKPCRTVYKGQYQGKWTRIADAPQCFSAAPRNVLGMGQEHLLIFSGDDGSQFGMSLAENHVGFSKDIYAYHTITNTWRKLGEIPTPAVSTNVVDWGGYWVIPAGENIPGSRSDEIVFGRWQGERKSFGIVNWIVVIAYFCFMIFLGYYFSRRENSPEDFFLGGRRVVWWAAGISTFGTGLSAITFMAIPAKSYSTDFLYFFSQVIAWIMIPVFVRYFIPFYRRLRVSTIYEYLEMRFNLASRLIAGVLFVVFQICRMGIVVFLPAITLATITGMELTHCIIVMGIICIFYTVMGGIEAVIWSDVFQVVILMGAALLSLILIVVSCDGGITGFFHQAWADGKFRSFDWSWDYTVPTVWVIFVGRVIGHLKEMASQDLGQRMLSTPNEKSARQVVYVNGACAVFSAVIFMMLGTGLYVFFKDNPHLLSPDMRHDGVLPLFIVSALPAGASGLVIAGIFAAAMSSLDSGMNSGAQVIINDFYSRVKPNLSEKHYLFLGRILTVVLGVIGTGTALSMAIAGEKILSLWDLMLGFIGMFTGPVAGLFTVGVFTRRTHGLGGLIGLIVSIIVVFAVQNYTRVNFFLYGAVGIVTCFVVSWLASLIIPVKAKNIDGLTIYTMPERVD